MLLDPSSGEQSYVEDCEVCCNPIQVSPHFREGELLSFEVRALGR